MSGLPIMSPLNSAPLSMRDSAAALIPAPSRGVPAAAKTITASAVQQSSVLDASDAVPRKTMPMAHEKRGRLVGPPPTFEVNVLQHLQETRMLPDDTDPKDQAPADIDDSGARMPESDAPVPTAPTKTPAYLSLEQISKTDNPDQATVMNISI